MAFKCCDFAQEANEIITIRKQILTSDSHGGQTMSWEVVLEPWTWVKPVSDFNVAEQYKNDQLQATATHKMVIRFDQDFKNVKDFAAYSILFDGRTFNILNIKNFDNTMKNYGEEFQEILAQDNGPEVEAD